MSAHTPGPWRVGQEIKSAKRLVYIRIEHDGAESSLSNTSVYPHRRDGSTFATKTLREAGEDRPAPHVSEEECRANARLIAAAPEMLEALRVIEVLLAVGPGHALLDIPEVRAAWDKARTVITKAEGR